MAWNQIAALADELFVERLARAPGVGTLRALRPAISWGQDSATTTIQHTAFPSVVQLRDGTLAMVVRRGTNHSATRDGGVWYATSPDWGRTWTLPVLLWAAAGGLEYRDPCISLAADGSTLYITYFKGSAASPAAGCFFRTIVAGVASAEVRIDGAKPYAACCCPVVETSTGVLVVAFYGKDLAGDAWESVYIASSSNAGVTWVQNKIYNGVGVGTHLQEPWVSRKPGANDLLMTFRWGNNSQIGVGTTSQTDGLGWAAPTVPFAGTGRPSSCWLSTGEQIVIYRETNHQLMWARLRSAAGSWSAPTLVRRTPSGGFWTYGQPIEISPGVALTVFTEESAGLTPSKLYTTALGRGGGWSPLGEIPTDAVAVATGYDTIEYSTTFKDRMPAGTGPEWVAMVGSLTVAGDGYLASTNADGTPDRSLVDVNNPNANIEAEVFQTVQSGAAILFRIIDGLNYLMWTSETLGTFGRLYKVVAGAATQLASGGADMSLGTWGQLRVEVSGKLIRGYINGVSVAGYILAAGAEADTFTTPGRVGIGLNAPAGGAHYCRRFIVRGW